MKRLGWITGSVLSASLLAAGPARVVAQAAPATVHGHVNNAAGGAITKGEVRFTTDRSTEEKNRKYPYVFPIDGNGDYKGTGIAPGSYLGIVFIDGKTVDFIDNVSFSAGADKLQNFDETRKEYIDKMTPEEKAALEEYKKKNGEATKANQVVANLNNLLTQARTAMKAGNYDEAITAMNTATTSKPDESLLWVTLGDAQLGSADAAAKAARAAKTSPSDPAITQKYKDAVASYQKGIDLNAASKKPSPETAGAANNQMGQALAKLGDAKGSAAAYDNAAKAQPAQAGMYMFNEAATLLNAGQNDEAAAAADKAIAADPKRADAYYIKGQALISKASVDPKTQKIVAPPGCVEAYQKYLDLAPDGPHASEVAEILTGIGATVTSKYKAPGKK